MKLPEPLPELPDARMVSFLSGSVSIGGYLYRPAAGTTSVPAIVLLHGHGADALNMAEPARWLCQEGYIALTISMRGWRGSGGVDDCGLCQADDTVKAVEWLADQPGVDADRIGILGVSQGGQVALLAGAKTGRLKAIAAYKPVIDLDRWRETTDNSGIVEYVDSICSPERRQRSPVAYAANIQAPVLLIHGTADTRVPTEQSELMNAALLKAGKTVELHLIHGVGHSFGPEGNKKAWAWTLAFFSKHL